jgi:cytochrome P450
VELDVFPWLRHFGSQAYARRKKQPHVRQQLWDYLKREVRNDEDDSLVRLWLKLKETEPSVQDLNIQMTFSTMIVAGTSTTTNSFYMFLSILCQHPHLQAKLQAEVDAVVGMDRYVTLEDKIKMPFTQATVFELLRYTTVVPLGIPHACTTDTSIGGKRIPQGTQVLLNLWALHHDESFWKNSFQFRPERFLDAEGEVVSASHENRRRLMPFGAGPRVCVGEVLALGRLFLIIATMAQVFDIEQGDMTASCDPRDYRHGLVLHSDDFEIKVKSRNDSLFYG